MPFVLIITNKDDLTSDIIVKALCKKNIRFYRLNTEELSRTVFISFDFSKNIFEIIDTTLEQHFNVESFSSVYYRRPKLPSAIGDNLSYGEKEFVKNEFFYTLEELYKLLEHANWINPISSIRTAENKLYQLSIAKSVGFIIPNTIVTNIYSRAQEFYLCGRENCIIKSIHSGNIEDNDKNGVIFTSRLEKMPPQKEIEALPVLLQSNIEKICDVRVTVVGRQIFSTIIDSQVNERSKVDWRVAGSSLRHQKIRLSDEMQMKCMKLLETLNLRFGAIDFVLDKSGGFIFLEINPNGEWAWVEERTGYNISGAIIKLLINEDH